MSEGIVVQVIGAVIDVEFSRENLPKVYDALVVEDSDLILEVQQQLGDGVVRTIAMTCSPTLRLSIFFFILSGFKFELFIV